MGSFASGTVSDARTHYHGWLIAALDPPSRRTLLLALDASLEWQGCCSVGNEFLGEWQG